MLEQDKSIEALRKVKSATRKYLLPDIIKPCVALMMEESFEKGQGLRDKVAFIIATELRRLGKTPEKAEEQLNMWDINNNPPLGNKVISNKVKSAYRKAYTFGCNNELLQSFCIKADKIFCGYYQEFLRLNNIKSKHSDRDFFRYGWQHHTSLAEKCAYFSIIELEKQYGIRPGSLVYVSHRRFNKVSGISLQSIGKVLLNLDNKGLTKYKSGEPYRWRVKASEIIRIIPIPKPKDEYQK